MKKKISQLERQQNLTGLQIQNITLTKKKKIEKENTQKGYNKVDHTDLDSNSDFVHFSW